MTQTQITLSDNLDSLLSTLAIEQGKKKEEIILEAVEAYVHKPLTREETLLRRRAARGIWKERTDLPDFAELRRSRDLNWSDGR